MILNVVLEPVDKSNPAYRRVHYKRVTDFTLTDPPGSFAACAEDKSLIMGCIGEPFDRKREFKVFAVALLGESGGTIEYMSRPYEEPSE